MPFQKWLAGGTALDPATTSVDFVGATASKSGDTTTLTFQTGDITAVTAGAGLTGGGSSGAVSVAVGAGAGITVNADDVALAATVAGAGLTLTAGVLDVVGGSGITANANDIQIATSHLAKQTTQLTNAQMLALRAAPITVVTAPGAGKVVEFISATLIFDYTAAYTETADNMQIKYVDGSGTAASAAIEATGFVDATADAVTFVGPAATAPILTAAGEVSNAALVIHNIGDGEYGGGNAANTVTVSVLYRIHTTGL